MENRENFNNENELFADLAKALASEENADSKTGDNSEEDIHFTISDIPENIKQGTHRKKKDVSGKVTKPAENPAEDGNSEQEKKESSAAAAPGGTTADAQTEAQEKADDKVSAATTNEEKTRDDDFVKADGDDVLEEPSDEPENTPDEDEDSDEYAEELEKLADITEDEIVPVPEASEHHRHRRHRHSSDGEGESGEKISVVKIIGVLVSVCVVIALLLAVVNYFTKDKIAENVTAERNNAMSAIFPDAESFKEYTAAGGETVYIPVKEGKALGYCAEAGSNGFGGEITVMVGVDRSGAVKGVRIVDMSETPGIGTKTRSQSFTDRFNGITGEAIAGTNVDMITGATFSSRAVIESVNKVLGLEVDLSGFSASDN